MKWISDDKIQLEFEIDTTDLKKNIIKGDTVDFTKIYECYFINQKPILPFFKFPFLISENSISIHDVKKEEIKYNNLNIKYYYKKKRSNINDSTYYTLEDSNLITLTPPYTFDNLSGQNIILRPFQFDNTTKTLNVYYSVSMILSFNKKFETSKIINNSNSVNYPSNYFLNQNKKKSLKSLDSNTPELAIIFRDSNYENSMMMYKWKNQKGIKTHLINVKKDTTSEYIKSLVSNLKSTNSNLKYLLILGNQNEIPAYNYGYIDGDNYFSDSYFGQLTNDLYPDIYIGRITGTTKEINKIIQKSIFYEKNNINGDWISNAIGIGSNEGVGIGDNGEADWQHLRKIKQKLSLYGYQKIYEFYDGSHQEEDANGNPNKNDIINAINSGIGIVNYTGHGDTQLMLTSQLSNLDLNNLNNKEMNPWVISVACNNGKFTDGVECIGEKFMKSKSDTSFTGSIAFCGSSILMDWAPPMKTQDEIVNTIINSDSVINDFTIGELFYTSQAKMLDSYHTLGNGVVETWILFGDPSTTFKSKKAIDLSYTIELDKINNQIIISNNDNNVLLGISCNGEYINSTKLKIGTNLIDYPQNSCDSLLLTFSKPNYKTTQHIISNSENSTSNLNFELFPNPTFNNKVYVNKIDEQIVIKCFDLQGKQINLNRNTKGSFSEFTFDQIQPGCYFLLFIDNNHIITSKKLIIE